MNTYNLDAVWEILFSGNCTGNIIYSVKEYVS